jgi:hypothetical protein
MPSFAELFAAANGGPIVYGGKVMVLEDNFPVAGRSHLRLVFEKFGSEWLQGVVLKTKGAFTVDGSIINTSIVLWQNTAPRVVDFSVTTKSNVIRIWNVWDRGRGISSHLQGAAMIVEQLGNGRRYCCNDGHPDENFDDIVFRLERLEAQS